MAAGATYEPIATTTLGSTSNTINFGSIPSTYTDLRLILVGSSTLANDISFRINSDSGATYSQTSLTGDGSAASSAQTAGDVNFSVPGGRQPTANVPYLFQVDIFSYTGSTKKTCLYSISMDKNGSGSVSRVVGLWNSTAAISTVTFSTATSTFTAGTTATLYGIKAA